MNSFGDYLKGLRKAKGVHLREVGRNIGLSAGFISRLETGKKKDTLTVGKLMEIAEYYGVSKLEMCLATIVDGCGCPCKMTNKTDKVVESGCKNIKKQIVLPNISTDTDIFTSSLCSNCIFHSSKNGGGICRESSPVTDRETGKSVFPVISDYGWCGKHKPKPAPKH